MQITLRIWIELVQKTRIWIENLVFNLTIASLINEMSIFSSTQVGLILEKL